MKPGRHTASKTVLLGRVGKPQGLRGQMRLKLYNPDSDLLWQHDKWLLSDGVEIREITAKKIRRLTSDVVVIAIPGISSRDQAEALRGNEVALDADLLPPTDEDEWYVRDLVGLEAVSSDGAQIGVVRDTINYPSVDCLVIESGEARYEIPMVSPYLESVDIEHGQVVIASLGDFDPLPLKRRTSALSQSGQGDEEESA